MALSFIYSASAVLFLWGLSHIIPTPAVVRGFGALSPDNRRILLMEWVAEGLALCFIAVLTAAVAFLRGFNETSVLVFRLCSGMLVLMALWTLFTGARTSVLPIKICPFVKTACAAAIYASTLL